MKLFDKEAKEKLCQLQLNEIKTSDDPTKLSCSFVIFDFDVSHNNTVISKDVALEAASTIINKPIVAKYYEVDELNTSTDALGTHEAYLDTDKHGELEVKRDTAPIGVFTSEGYITEIETPDGKKKYWQQMQYFGALDLKMHVNFYLNGMVEASTLIQVVRSFIQITLCKMVSNTYSPHLFRRSCNFKFRETWRA